MSSYLTFREHVSCITASRTEDTIHAFDIHERSVAQSDNCYICYNIFTFYIPQWDNMFQVISMTFRVSR